MKLSEIKGEQALDVLADIIDPVGRILADGSVYKLVQSGKPKMFLVKHIIKTYKKEVIEIMARLDFKEPKEYEKEMNIVTLPIKLLELLNDEDLLQVFQSQGQNMAQTSSGSAMVNTEVEKN